MRGFSLIRASLSHGHISHELLACGLTPIVKDPNGNISLSKNYRGTSLVAPVSNPFP